jgi:hypothetical protein
MEGMLHIAPALAFKNLRVLQHSKFTRLYLSSKMIIRPLAFVMETHYSFPEEGFLK